MLQMKLLTPLLWLLALLLAAWTFARLPLVAITHSLSALSGYQSAFWFGLNLLIIALGNYRWQLLNHLFGLRPGFGRLLMIRLAGQAVSFITPGPHCGGEPLQVYWLHRLCKLSLGKTVLALGIDRLLELWVNFAVLLIGIVVAMSFFTAELTEGPAQTGVVLLLLSLMLLLPWVLLRRPRWVTSNLQKIAQRWLRHPRFMTLETGLQNMGEDLRAMFANHKPVLRKALGLALVGWVLLLLELRIVLAFVGVDVDVPGLFLILISLRLAMLLPVPGGIGTIEASLLWSLQSLGFPAEAALGAIALMRLRDAVVLGCGLLCLRLMRMPDREVMETMDSGIVVDGAQAG